MGNNKCWNFTANTVPDNRVVHISRVVWASVFTCHTSAWKRKKMKSKPTKDQSFQDCRLKGWSRMCQIRNGWKCKWALQCLGESLQFLAIFLSCYAWVWFSLACTHFCSLHTFTPLLFRLLSAPASPPFETDSNTTEILREILWLVQFLFSIGFLTLLW